MASPSSASTILQQMHHMSGITQQRQYHSTTHASHEWHHPEAPVPLYNACITRMASPSSTSTILQRMHHTNGITQQHQCHSTTHTSHEWHHPAVPVPLYNTCITRVASPSSTGTTLQHMHYTSSITQQHQYHSTMHTPAPIYNTYITQVASPSSTSTILQHMRHTSGITQQHQYHSTTHTSHKWHHPAATIPLYNIYITRVASPSRVSTTLQHILHTSGITQRHQYHSTTHTPAPESYILVNTRMHARTHARTHAHTHTLTAE